MDSLATALVRGVKTGRVAFHLLRWEKEQMAIRDYHLHVCPECSNQWPCYCKECAKQDKKECPACFAQEIPNDAQ